MKNKKIVFLFTLALLFTFNIKNVKAIDSGVAGGSDSSAQGNNDIDESKGSIINFNSSPAIRITAVNKNGEKITGSYSVDYYTSSLSSDIYYKGYKYSIRNITSSSFKSKQDDFFGLTTSDNYDTVFNKIKYTLEHKTETEISKFIESNLGINKSKVNELLLKKDIFLLIEPVFKIYDGEKYVTGTSSEIIKYLDDLKSNGKYLYNLHYWGTLDLMGKGLIMYTDDVNEIESKGFTENKINPATKTNFTNWSHEMANKVQSSSYSFGMVMYYVGDFIDPPPSGKGYYCVSLTNICNTKTDVNINGVVSALNISGSAYPVSNATCIYNNSKYKYGETNTYCSAKITSSTSSIINQLDYAKIGSFVGITKTPSLTITWDCYSETEKDVKSTMSSIEQNKMPDIKYSYLGKTYTYKNSSITQIKSGTTQKGTTDYGSNYYNITKVLKYDYKYESDYLNKWVDKETGEGSKNSSVKPISSNQYSVNKYNINFEIPSDKSVIGTNNINVIFDTTSVSNLSSNYFTKYNDNNDIVEIKVENKTITFNNINSEVGHSDFKCPSTFEIDDTIIIPESIIYRPIDLSNPFPGKDGEGRKIGYNWRVDDDISDSYKNNVEKYITSRQDVYSKTPLYSVTLTPSIIKEIRKYNKDNDYGDNNTLSCDENGYYCYSTFLRNEKFSNMIDQNKSMCYNINNTTSSWFDSCVIYSDRK